MRKETTVLLVCLLILFADVLSIRQTINLRFDGRFLPDRFPAVAILISLGVFAALLLWINYAPVRKIIGGKLS